ncbi:unnamed protein product [Trichogramma brassicae]|uniref:ATP-grasp domain-containing protein n=1 Tax=Trichogramma brassicae TaxID=86971 RepID=A0A6H5IEL5_9HYME|nr:unnamed protein product [Trichogramma brassicae]
MIVCGEAKTAEYFQEIMVQLLDTNMMVVHALLRSLWISIDISKSQNKFRMSKAIEACGKAKLLLCVNVFPQVSHENLYNFYSTLAHRTAAAAAHGTRTSYKRVEKISADSVLPSCSRGRRAAATAANILYTHKFINIIRVPCVSHACAAAAALLPRTAVSILYACEPNYSGPLRSRSASRTRRTRSRSRSRSRARQGSGVNSISLVNDDEVEDRSFSKAMYSLSDNFGVTGRTLNDRFSGSLLGIATRKGAQQRQPKRDLNIHENQAYTLLRSACIPTPEFGVAKTPEEAYEIAKELGSGDDLVLKAQVLAGGRGKGRFKDSSVSGVVMCETPEEAKDISSKMLGKMLVTKQTGESGRICNSVMVTTRSYSRKELYVSVMMERAYGGPVVIASSQGGVNIEDVAATNPEAISYTPVDPNCGLQREQADRIACKLGVADPEIVSDIIMKLYKLFVEKDALLLEINPLVQDICGKCEFLSLNRIPICRARDLPIFSCIMYRFRARLQVQLRRQRRVPAEGAARPARLEPVESGRGAGREALAQLHTHGRQHRLHGERGGPRHGHHGHHQAQGRRARQLPGHRRQPQCRGHSRGHEDHLLGREGSRGAGQHLRRHQSLRPRGRGRDRRLQEARLQSARGGSTAGHQCGQRQADAARGEAQNHTDRGRHGGSGRDERQSRRDLSSGSRPESQCRDHSQGHNDDDYQARRQPCRDSLPALYYCTYNFRSLARAARTQSRRLLLPFEHIIQRSRAPLRGSV